MTKPRNEQTPDAVGGTGRLRKLTPKVEPPAPAVLRQFSTFEQELISRRLIEPLECVFDPEFKKAQVVRELLGPLPELKPAKVRRAAIDPNDESGIDLWSATHPETIKLTAAQERFLFARYNYLRFRLMKVLREFQGQRLTAEGARELLHWEKLALETRNIIISVNVPLVMAMARRNRIAVADFGELVSEGNLALIRSVDKFDATRGFKFSTYACRAILKSFTRVAAKAAQYRGFFPAEYDPTLEKSDFLEQRRDTIEGEYVDALRSILGSNLADLNDVEQRVIRARFALDEDIQPPAVHRIRTLEQVGEIMGVTKERVRQIQSRAVGKLRGALQDQMEPLN